MLKAFCALLVVGILGLLAEAARADDLQVACGSDATAVDNGSVTGGADGNLSPAPQPVVNSGGCDCAGSCEMSDCPMEPVWSIDAGAVFMARSSPDPRQIIHPIGSTATLSDGSDLNFGFSTGVELTFARRIFCDNSVEVRYVGGFDWASSANYGAAGNFQLGSILNFGAIGLTANDDTFLNSAEINWLHPLTDRITLLAGARWLELRDDLQYRVTFPAFSASYEWNVDNRLLGAQIGSKLALWKLDGPLSIDAALKAGVYSDSADNTFALRPSTGGSFSGGATGTATSFVGEIDVQASYAFTRHMAVHGGYEMLWIDHAALASDQAAAATANNTQNAISATANLFTYGATVGFDVTW